MKARILSIAFNQRERPRHAVVLTARGLVEVEWKQVAGDWCWFTTTGRSEAKMLAIPVIERIHRKFLKLPSAKKEMPCRYCGRPSEDGSGVCARCERTYERQ